MSNIGNHLLPSNNRSLLVQKKKSMNTPGHYWRKYGECAAILGDPGGGGVSRAGRKGATKVFKHRRKSPWVPTLTRPNGQANAGSWLGTKNALYYCAQSTNSISWVLFVSLYMTTIDSITACLAHAPKNCTQSGNFQFNINSPFQNTVYPKTTDAFPKIQAWAYNRYPHLHRSCLRKYYGVKDAMTADTQTKSEFAFFQSLSWLFQLAYFVKCKQTLLELNFYQPYPSS